MSTPSFLNQQFRDQFERHRSVIEGKWPDLHVEDALGAGTFGAVYRCTKRAEGVDRVNAQRAVKVIDVQQPEDEREMKRQGKSPQAYYEAKARSCQDEIDSMENVESPNIVHSMDFARVNKPDHPSCYFLIQMALYRSAEDYLTEHVQDSRAQAEALAKKLGGDICNALKSCRANGKVHRDIKPSNIFMSTAGDAEDFYLGDFGLARSMSASARVTTGGSAGYMAPEAYVNRRPDHRSDIYSLGLVLYEVLNHGRLPFYPAYPKPYDHEDELDAGYCMLDASMEKPAPDNCSAEFAQVVLKACSYDINDRYQTAEEFAQALQALEPGRKKAAPAKPKAVSGKKVPVQPEKKASSAGNPAPPAKPAPGQSKTNTSRRVPDPQPAVPPPGRSRPVPGRQPPEPPPEPPKADAREEWQRLQKEEEKKKRSRILIAAVLLLALGIAAYAGIRNILVDQIMSSISNLVQQMGAEQSEDGSVSLLDLDMMDGSGAQVQEQVANSLGHVLDKALVLDSWGGSAFARYNVEEYDRLTGVFSCPDEGVGSQDQCRLTIYLDDKPQDPLVDAAIFRSISETPFDLDVSGAQSITFQIDPDGGGYITTNRVALSDCRLYKGQSPSASLSSPETDSGGGEGAAEPAPIEEKLTALHIVQSNGAEVGRDVMNSLGQTYGQAVVLSAWGESAYVRYYVADYAHISGAYSCPDSYGDSEQCRLVIYLDDQIDAPVLEDAIFRSIPETPFELDLNGAQFITFRLYPAEGGMITSASAMFTDCVVTG